MLVKVNTMSRSPPSPAPQQQHIQHSAQNKANTFTLQSSSGSKVQAGHSGSTQGYKTAPSGKMAADTRQAHHLRKASNGSFCLVASEGSHPSPLLHRSQTSTPRPVSPQYGCSPPIYDEPVSDCPIYDEPPIDMEVEGAHLYNGQLLSRLTPTHSLQKPRHIPQPGSTNSGSRHRRNPSASDYSPAGLECIKHMINVDPKQGLVSGSPLPTRTPSPNSRQDPVSTQPQPHPQPQVHSLPQTRIQLRDREAGTPGPSTLDKKQSWRVLEATVQRAMEARHSRQSSQASQDFPSSTSQATANYQDSGYSTGPSPSLRRKSRRRVGAGGGAGGRPGSVGSTGELCALNERLMAEMREVVSRSNTMREVRVGLDPEIGERVVVSRTRSPADSLRWYGGGLGTSVGKCSSREELTGAARSLSRAGNPALTPLDITGRQKRPYEKVDTLEMSISSLASLSSPETPGPPSQVPPLTDYVYLFISHLLPQYLTLSWLKLKE